VAWATAGGLFVGGLHQAARGAQGSRGAVTASPPRPCSPPSRSSILHHSCSALRLFLVLQGRRDELFITSKVWNDAHRPADVRCGAGSGGGSSGCWGAWWCLLACVSVHSGLVGQRDEQAAVQQARGGWRRRGRLRTAACSAVSSPPAHGLAPVCSPAACSPLSALFPDHPLACSIT
jgi:hypothetical protein